MQDIKKNECVKIFSSFLAGLIIYRLFYVTICLFKIVK